MTYAVLSAVFVVAAALVLAFALATAGHGEGRHRLVRRWWPAAVIAGVVLIVLTAVFDNLMIGSGLMSYGRASIAGIRLGLIPVEDFAYPVAGLLLLPAVWMLTRRRSS